MLMLFVVHTCEPHPESDAPPFAYRIQAHNTCRGCPRVFYMKHESYLHVYAAEISCIAHLMFVRAVVSPSLCFSFRDFLSSLSNLHATLSAFGD